MSLSRRELMDVAAMVDALPHLRSSVGGGLVAGTPRWNWPMLLDPNFDATRWLQIVGYADSMPYGDARDLVKLEADAHGSLRFRPPLRIDWQTLPMTEAALFTPNMDRVLVVLCELLSIPTAHRRAQCLVPDALWSLGNLRIHQQAIPIYVARKFEFYRKAITDQLLDAKHPERGLILTACRRPLQLDWPLPRQLRAVRLVDVLRDTPEAAIDLAAITRVLGQGHVVTQQEPAVQFNSVTNTLTIAGIAKPWVLKGDKQIKAIAYLFEQLKKGRESVGADELLAASGTRSTSVAKLFAGGVYEDYLCSSGRGLWAFNFDK
jgi:hypothetical protein